MARILIVEDYPNLLSMYKHALEKEHFEVWVAKDGDDALEICRQHEPDLILLDLLLPNRGGLEFMQAFNKMKYSHVKIIIISNMSSPELLEEASALGASEYLLKAKYTPKQVAEIVKDALSKN